MFWQAKCDILPDAIDGLIHRLCSTQTPLVFWAGFRPTPVLVASQFANRWAARMEVPTRDSSLTGSSDSAADASEHRIRLVLPRRWRDIYGNTLPHIWDAGQKAVLGWIWCRPGISEVSIRVTAP